MARETRKTNSHQGAFLQKPSAVGIALAVLASAPAVAADIPVKAAPMVAVYNWTGFYVGGALGERWTNASWTTTGIEDAGLPVASALGNPATANASFNSAGFRFGGYAGYNWQLANWVVGVEGAVGSTSSSSTTITQFPGVAYLAGQGSNDHLRGESDIDASIKGRAGYLLTPSLLLYGTGGLAIQQFEFNATCSVPATSWCGDGPHAQTDSLTRVGWTVGAGLEFMLSRNWLARVDYAYSDFGTQSLSFFEALGQQDGLFANSRLTTQLLTAGLAYKF
jgi:outer membrane immunogenic protein